MLIGTRRQGLHELNPFPTVNRCAYFADAAVACETVIFAELDDTIIDARRLRNFDMIIELAACIRNNFF